MATMVWQDFFQFLTFITALINLSFLIWLYFRITTVIETHGLLNDKSPFVKKEEKIPILPRYNGD